MLRRWIRVVVLLLAALACPRTGWAVTNVSHGGFSIRIWQFEDGLPQNTVTALTQTRDGYIWIGTLSGLARFDGERFLTFDTGSTPGLGDNRISALFEDHTGTLWIGHETGLLTRYQHGRFESLPASTGTSAKISALGTDEQGVLWLLRGTGVLERAGEPAAPNRQDDSGRVKLLRYARSATGQIWFSVEGDARKLHEGKIIPVDLGRAQFTGYVRGLCAAADGGWWIVHDGQIRKWSDGTWTENRGTWGTSEINASLELRDGTLAYATMDSGLHLIRPDGSVLGLNYQSSLIQNWVRVLFEDREGNIWIGAGSGGLAMARPTDFSVLSPPDKWQGRTVLAVVPDRTGALWVGTEGSGVYRYFENQWKYYGMEQGFENLFIWSIAALDDGEILVGTWGDGVYRLEGEKFRKAPELAVGTTPVFAMQYSRTERSLWIGTGNGLFRTPPEKSAWLLHNEKPAEIQVLGIAQDERGPVWLALGDAGLGQLTDFGIQRFGQQDGLSGRNVQCLLADGDTLWIGTRENGLSRFRAGQFSAIGVNQGLPSKEICHIADDGRGHLWMSTHHGIFRVAKEELHRCADGLVPVVAGQVYDKNDGLPTLEFSGGFQSAGCRTEDGRLWFASGKGLVSVDPAAIRINPQVPPVQIESLRVDGQPVALDEKNTRQLLRPEHERLEFQYTALSLVASGKTLFKYRLHGLDQDWIDAGTKRSASYSHLPAGEYRFHVIACNNDGLWNTVGASLGITVLPFYWQTWWFRGGATLIVLFSVGAIVRHQTRRRLQRRVEELEYERGIERERARIAQDIHDDIGSSLTRISMLSQPARLETAAPGRSANVMERIHATALEVTHTLDEIVWAVNPQHDTLDSLTSYLARFAQDRLGEAQIGCRYDLPVNLPDWPLSTQIRHELLLAFKEAINNALKHAAATEVTIALQLGPQEFRISVQDDGRGFDLAVAAGGPTNAGRGNGLGNLRHRLVRIGGECDIISAPGKGTRVVFIVRLKQAPPVPV